MKDAEVICGDALAVLKTLQSSSVDAVVTSPPYAMQRKATYGGIPERDYPAWTVAWMDAVRPALKDDGSVLIVISEHVRKPIGMSDYLHRTRLAVREAGWVEVDELAWIKPNGPPIGSNGRPRRSWERVLWFAKRCDPYCQPIDTSKRSGRISPSLCIWARRCKIGGSGSLKTPRHPRYPNYVMAAVGQDGKGIHPAVYPLKLARWLVSLMGPVILDPFCGSGTTGVVCLQTGRRFLGIDQSEAYCEIARKRLASAVVPAGA